MTTKNFVTISTFGDIIYSLCVVKMLGGGNLYVKLNALDDFARTVMGWPDAGSAVGRLTQQDYDVIAPLLHAQDYLNHVAIWDGQTDDYPQLMDHWRMHLLKGWQGNQTECYALTVGMNIHDPGVRKQLLFDPWLTAVEPIKIPGKSVVINRTNRHLHGADGNGWADFIHRGLADSAVFIGSESEHAAFQEQFKINIMYYKTHDLLHVAQVIQGSEMFIGNQSSALSIAIGLGKTYWCELRADYERLKTPHGGYGDVWFPRTNGFYF
jgi:hypothetical protein